MKIFYQNISKFIDTIYCIDLNLHLISADSILKNCSPYENYFLLFIDFLKQYLDLYAPSFLIHSRMNINKYINDFN